MQSHLTQNGLEAYKKYVSIRLHFSSPDYNYFQFKGSTKASFDSYKKRKDAIFFEMLAKKSDVEQFIAFSFAQFDSVFPKELVTNKKYEDSYSTLKYELDSLSYCLRKQLLANDIQSVEDMKLFLQPNGFKHPLVIQKYLAKTISLITLCALDVALDLRALYDEKIQEKTVWPLISLKVNKLQPFLNINKQKVSEVIKGLDQ
jgi:hypothetical protein